MSISVGDRVQKLKPWKHHGKPDTDARRHTGRVIPRGCCVPGGYYTVVWDDGFVSSVHVYDVIEVIEERG